VTLGRRFPKAAELRRTLTPATPWAQRDRLPKDGRVNLRVSSEEKAEMAAAAEEFGLNVSEYLLKLHRVATAIKAAGRDRRR
jgi:hypothetical protein